MIFPISKVSSNGDVIWLKGYTGESSDRPLAVAHDDSFVMSEINIAGSATQPIFRLSGSTGAIIDSFNYYPTITTRQYLGSRVRILDDDSGFYVFAESPLSASAAHRLVRTSLGLPGLSV